MLQNGEQEKKATKNSAEAACEMGQCFFSDTFWPISAGEIVALKNGSPATSLIIN